MLVTKQKPNVDLRIQGLLAKIPQKYDKLKTLIFNEDLSIISDYCKSYYIQNIRIIIALFVQDRAIMYSVPMSFDEISELYKLNRRNLLKTKYEMQKANIITNTSNYSNTSDEAIMLLNQISSYSKEFTFQSQLVIENFQIILSSYPDLLRSRKDKAAILCFGSLMITYPKMTIVKLSKLFTILGKSKDYYYQLFRRAGNRSKMFIETVLEK